MEIVDKVNHSDDQFANKTMKYLAHRLGKTKHNVVMMTLFLVESLVKNSEKFRVAININNGVYPTV